MVVAQNECIRHIAKSSPGAMVVFTDADSIMNIPDFRAGERCFQLLVQAAGRAGRSNSPGEVIIQSYNPDDPIIQLAASQDYEQFYKHEIKIRSMLNYPPFTQILRIVCSSEMEDAAAKYAQNLVQYIDEIIDASEEDITILGPAQCPIAKIRRRYRYHILIKCISWELLHSIAAHILNQNRPKHVKMELDINPVTTI